MKGARQLHPRHLGLKKDIGFFTATACGVGVVLGAGIYVLIGLAAGTAGNSVWLSFFISAIVAILTGFSYAELASMFAKNSGEYIYVKKALGNRFGFLAGYSILIAGLTSGTTVALGFAGYFISLFGQMSILIPSLALILLFTFINIIGVKQSTRLNVFFTLVEVFGLLAIIAMSLTKWGAVNYLEMPNGSVGLFNAAALVFFAFIGFEGVIKLSEETKNAKKVIPKALLWSIIISGVIYVLVAISAVSVLDWQVLGQSKAPLADVARQVMGSGAGILLALIALASTGNTVLLSLLMTSRTIYGFGEEVPTLSFLKKVNKKTRTPIIATLIAMSITVLFLFIKNIETVAEIANFSIFFTFILVNLAVIILRYKLPKVKRKFKTPLNYKNFSVMALLGLLASFFMILNLKLHVIFSGLGLTLLGVIISEVVNNKRWTANRRSR